MNLRGSRIGDSDWGDTSCPVGVSKLESSDKEKQLWQYTLDCQCGIQTREDWESEPEKFVRAHPTWDCSNPKCKKKWIIEQGDAN